MKSLDELKALLTAQVEADYAEPDGRMAISDKAYDVYLAHTGFFGNTTFDEGDVDTLRKLIDTMEVDATVHVHFADDAAEEPPVG